MKKGYIEYDYSILDIIDEINELLEERGLEIVYLNEDDHDDPNLIITIKEIEE